MIEFTVEAWKEMRSFQKLCFTDVSRVVYVLYKNEVLLFRFDTFIKGLYSSRGVSQIHQHRDNEKHLAKGVSES